jgi:AcrR family transcriptional regulator
MSPRHSAAAARDTRDAILTRAVDVASLEGLEGLTIGRLAADLRMSKAGVIGQFGSKEALQLATLQQAIERFRGEVWQPVAEIGPGLRRLQAVFDAWISYLERDVFPGGCFLTAASSEFDGRSGPVRDAIAQAMSRWSATLEADADAAREAGQLPADIEPAQVAFELAALALGVNQARQLHRDAHAGDRARSAARRILAGPQDHDRPSTRRKAKRTSGHTPER